MIPNGRNQRNLSVRSQNFDGVYSGLCGNLFNSSFKDSTNKKPRDLAGFWSLDYLVSVCDPIGVS
jgi:hypothetical protein